MGKKRYSRQQQTKLYERFCLFCGEDDYALLDVHRIFEGANGGTYDPRNTVVVCSKCHRKIHAKRIVVHGKHPSTGKKLWAVHCTVDGEEKWL
jgi:hypothetical protein